MASPRARTSSGTSGLRTNARRKFAQEFETEPRELAYDRAMTPAQRPFAPVDGYARQVVRLERGIGLVLWLLLAAVVIGLI